MSWVRFMSLKMDRIFLCKVIIYDCFLKWIILNQSLLLNLRYGHELLNEPLPSYISSKMLSVLWIMLRFIFCLPTDPKGPNSQFTQEQLAVLLNFLGQSKSAGSTAQFVQSMSSKVNQETLQQLSKALAPTDPAEPPLQPTTAKPPPPPPPPTAPAGVPHTPPMPKPPSPPMSAPPSIPEGEAATATQTAMTMLLAQLLQAQQTQRQEPVDGGEGVESTNSAGAAAPLLPPEAKQPPEPSPVTPGEWPSENAVSAYLQIFQKIYIDFIQLLF